MSVHKHKNGTYLVRYKNHTRRGFKTKREAQQYDARIRLEANEPQISKRFHDVIIDFVENKKNKVEYGTYTKIKNAINKCIIPNTDNKLISQITELDCREFRDCLYSMNYSSVHKNYLLNLYKAIFEHSKIYFKNANNPTYVCEPFKKTTVELIKHKDKELKIWTEKEFNKFIVNVNDKVYKNFFMIMYYTGMRIGEVQALQWIDFVDGELNIKKSITRKTQDRAYQVKQTKNFASMRKIGLGTNITKYLYDFKNKEMKLYGFKEDWYMFGRTRPLPNTTIDNVKSKAIKLANVKPICNHDFRHSHASNLIASGVNIVAVSKRLGHSDINMTLKVYSHLMKKSEEELIEIIDKSCQNLVNV